MRILLTGQSLAGPWSGVGYYTIQLFDALRRRPDVEELAIAAGPLVLRSSQWGADGDYMERGPSCLTWLQVAKRFARGVPLVRKLQRVVLARRLQRIATRWPFVHETNFVSPRLPVPLVTTVHDMSHIRCPQLLPKERRNWLCRQLDPCLQRSRSIITVSRFVRNELLELCPWLDEDHIFAAPLGVDHRRFHGRADDEALHHMRVHYRLPEQFGLFLGTLEPRKNLHRLLEAYARLSPNEQVRFPLVLAGMNGWHQTWLRQVLAQLGLTGAVRRLGYVPNAHVPLLMQAATVFCFPSRYEGFGLPPLEAAACGTAVLCSRAGALVEVMGDAACYVDADSPEDIADGLLRLLQDEEFRQCLRVRGRQRAAQFTWDRCAAATIKAYEAALRR